MMKNSLSKNVLLTTVLCIFLTSAVGAETYYASSTGGGDGTTAASPFRISDFWNVAKPGDVLLLLDGKYTGPNSMINPPQGLSGTAQAPIFIKANNDGQVELDGQFSNRPVHLFYNDYFVLEGFNAHSSNNAVVELNRSNYNIIRRVCAWDAADLNTGNCFGVHHGVHNVFEDCAGWGTARKTFTNSYGGDFTIFRRCWGRWERCTQIGPKMTFSFCYNSYNTIVENCIGTWDDDMTEVDQPYGIFSMDRNDGDKNANSKLLGCIAYLKKEQQFHADHLYFITKLNSVEIVDCLAYVEPGRQEPVKTFALYPANDGAMTSTLKAKKLTSIGGSVPPVIDLSWNPEEIFNTPDGLDLVAEQGHILEANTGAKTMQRYENGQLTDRPLWPWPMNQRIIDAMTFSGREPVDVTKTIFELAGGSVPLSRDRVAVNGVKVMEVGQTLPLDKVTKDTWYDVYLYFDHADSNWSNLGFADFWLNTPFYDEGDSLNRGGNFFSSDSYVMSLSISNRGLWVKQTEGSEEWRNVSGSTALYVDDVNNTYEINLAEGWVKVRMRFLPQAEVGLWSLNAYVKSPDGTTSPVFTQHIEVEPKIPGPIAVLTGIPRRVAGRGEVAIQLTTSTDLIASPGTLFFVDSQRGIKELTLTGNLPGNIFTGILDVDDIQPEGVGKFTLGTHPFVDPNGNSVVDLTGAKYLIIDKTAPAKPVALTGEFNK